ARRRPCRRDADVRFVAERQETYGARAGDDEIEGKGLRRRERAEAELRIPRDELRAKPRDPLAARLKRGRAHAAREHGWLPDRARVRERQRDLRLVPKDLQIVVVAVERHGREAARDVQARL